MAPSIVQLPEQHKAEHLQNCITKAKAINYQSTTASMHAASTEPQKQKACRS
jgi:hypothetical protein